MLSAVTSILNIEKINKLKEVLKEERTLIWFALKTFSKADDVLLLLHDLYYTIQNKLIILFAE